MDGGTFSGFIEVTQDQFRGSLLLPLFGGGPQQSMPFVPLYKDSFPEGERILWTHQGARWGQTAAMKIKTSEGPRLFLATDMEILTYQEALDKLSAQIGEAMHSAYAWMLEREAKRAADRGMTLAQYRAWRKDEETRFHRRQAAQTYQKLDEQALARINPDFEYSPRPAVRSPLAHGKKG